MSDTPFGVLVVTPPSTHSPSKRPPSPTSSLEVMVSLERGVPEENPLASLFPPTFWDDANATVLKVHEALLVDDLNPLMLKLSNDVMLSHIQKLVQVCYDNVGCFFFFFIFVFAKRDFYFILFLYICRLWGSPYSSLGSFWIWRRRKKVATAEPMIKSLSAENETLKNKVVILTVEAQNDKERVAALEKSL